MALKLYIEDISDPSYQYVDDGTPPSGYTETDDPIDWDLSAFPYIVGTGVLTLLELYDKLQTAYDALGTPTTGQKKAASRWFAIDESVRISVYTEAEQKEHAQTLYKNIAPISVEQAFINEIVEIDATHCRESIVSSSQTISEAIKMYMMVSGTIELECTFLSNATHHVKVNGAATIDFECIPAGVAIYLMLQQDGTGGHTITLPTFDNLNTQPTVQTAANKMDCLIVMKMHSGLHLHGYIKPTDTF